jgi:1-acyl-sn-glycerol-3-phosphate acyltransferase
LIKRYSFKIFKPQWPRWKIKLADLVLFSLTFLKVSFANKLLIKYKHLKNKAFIDAVMKDTGLECENIGLENIPKTGPVTLVANHPGGADVVATISSIGASRPDFVILANELICVEPVVDIVLPVNTMSKNTKVNADLIHKAYREGKVVVFYAAGKNSRYNEEGELRDRKWRTTFLEFALEYKTPVVILNIGGSNSKLFFKVSKFRENSRRFKKVPLENFFQLRELVNAKGKIKMMYSKPVSANFLQKKLKGSEVFVKRNLADHMHDFLYTMNNENLTFEPEE